MRIDLNADLGEGGSNDAALLAVVTSANVACGFHAGDEETMRAACREAATHGVAIGAHVSYRDREGFGRRPRAVPAPVIEDETAEQIAALRACAHQEGAAVTYLKPHGALYHRAARDEDCALALLAGAKHAGGLLAVLAAPPGVEVVAQGGPAAGAADAGPELGDASEINVGLYCFDGPRLVEALERLRPDNRAGWLDGDTPETPDVVTATLQERPADALQVRLWDPSSQLRFRAKGSVPPRPDGAPNAAPAAGPADG